MQKTNEQWSQEWDKFLTTTYPDTGFMQTSWWIDLMVRHGFDYMDSFYLVDGEILGGAKVLINEYQPGCFYLYIPDGPVLPENSDAAREQFRAIVAYLDQCRLALPAQKFSHLRIEPKWAARPDFTADFREFNGWFEPRSTVYVDLTASESTLLARMKYNGRHRIKKAAALGVTIVEDASSTAIPEFMAIYGDAMARKQLHPMNADFLVDLMHTLLAGGHGSLFFAEYEGQRIAAAIVIYFGERATYFFAGSRGEFQKLMAPYLLNYTIMLHAKALGYKWYDLYGVAPTDDPAHPWAGISVFKRNLGGVDVHFIPVLDYVFDEATYGDYLRFANQ